ncbi:hypothetical protein MACH26_18310 [Planctobacterium marinum]|uniref:DUF3080 domain-containing protein n=1 Tax=Planctobacterium marinum TaxID=1631968 RepID=A0AA48HXB2_9ALTE|nr:hypothetical protein MACH26_18310 [Planctobacterium marinum]
MAACTQKPWLHSTLEDYQSRLANILEIEPPSLITPNIISTTPKQVFSPQGSAEPLNIKLREFYNLPECGIKPIIAERNTTLGKLQAPSQRYLYEVRLLAALYRCMMMVDDEPQQEQRSIINRKEQVVVQSWHNLLYNSDEINSARFSSSTHFDEQEDHRSAIQNWQSLLRFSPEELKGKRFQLSDANSLETLLQSISKFKTPAKLRNDMRLLISTLPQITIYLETNMTQLNCLTNPGDKIKAEYLRNVFNLFFIQEIQPQAGKINDWYFQLSVTFEELGFTEHEDNTLNKSLHNDFVSSIKDHVAQWQVFFERCDIVPRN